MEEDSTAPWASPKFGSQMHNPLKGDLLFSHLDIVWTRLHDYGVFGVSCK